jgi:4-hydroxythreonine-4-phosphate dehydrogenase
MAEFLPVAVSMGDPAGIGPEIIVKAWARLNQTSRMSHTGPAFFCLGVIFPLPL